MNKFIDIKQNVILQFYNLKYIYMHDFPMPRCEKKYKHEIDEIAHVENAYVEDRNCDITSCKQF